MKICVLVKEVPDAAVTKRIDPSTGRLDRGAPTYTIDWSVNRLP